MPGEGSQEAAFRGKGMTHLGEEGSDGVCPGWEWVEREGVGTGTIDKGWQRLEQR